MSLDRSKPSVMLEFNMAAQPSLDEFKKAFKLKDNEVDEAFGIIPLPKSTETTYPRLISEEAADRIVKRTSARI